MDCGTLEYSHRVDGKGDPAVRESKVTVYNCVINSLHVMDCELSGCLLQNDNKRDTSWSAWYFVRNPKRHSRAMCPQQPLPPHTLHHYWRTNKRSHTRSWFWSGVRRTRLLFIHFPFFLIGWSRGTRRRSTRINL